MKIEISKEDIRKFEILFRMCIAVVCAIIVTLMYVGLNNYLLLDEIQSLIKEFHEVAVMAGMFVLSLILIMALICAYSVMNIVNVYCLVFPQQSYPSVEDEKK